MKWSLTLSLLLVISSQLGADTLKDARAHFTTTLTQTVSEGGAPPAPPSGLFDLVSYKSPLGDMPAYVTPSPKDGKKHPAIIWLIGGFSNSIDEEPWQSDPPDNDQTARAYREAGIIMMYASRRGGNNNPGHLESFYGEVDDVLAAKSYLEKLDYVDPSRIYLGGHSTGGTLALLTAECGGDFRAIFAFGPVAGVSRYGAKHVLYDTANQTESELRAPIKWLNDIKSPTFVFEGTNGNIVDLRLMQKASVNPLIHFYELQGKTHFATLSPTNKLIATKILTDTDPTCTITFTDSELGNPSAP